MVFLDQKSITGYYWIASPNGMNDESYNNVVICMDCGGGSMRGLGYMFENVGVRPLVSIPLDNVQVDPTTGSVNILTDAQLQQLQQ